MYRAAILGSALTVALLLNVALARAETAEVVSAAAPPAAGTSYSRTADGLTLLDEGTAYMVGARRLRLGLLAFDYGLTEQLSIGTDPPAWAVRAVVSVLLPNLHVKGAFYQHGPVTLAGQVSGYYGFLKDNGSASGSIIAVPLSLFASFRLHPRVWLHEELTYLYAHAFGTGDLNAFGVKGQVAGQAMQTGTMLEWRVTRIFSILAAGRVQLWTGRLAFNGSGSTDPNTSINIDGTAEARVAHPWNVIGGVAFLWRHVHLMAGAGYGYYFLPGMDVPYPSLGVVPELSLSVVL